jgi:hypothetical protein
VRALRISLTVNIFNVGMQTMQQFFIALDYRARTALRGMRALGHDAEKYEADFGRRRGLSN